MENNFEGFSVGSKNDQIGETSVEGFGSLVGSLLQLFHLTKV